MTLKFKELQCQQSKVFAKLFSKSVKLFKLQCHQSKVLCLLSYKKVGQVLGVASLSIASTASIARKSGASSGSLAGIARFPRVELLMITE